MSATIGLSPCWLCKRVFEFDLDTVPSIIIDPATDLPPDLDADSTQVVPDPAAVARSVKQPICPRCVRGFNARRRELGLPVVWAEPRNE